MFFRIFERQFASLSKNIIKYLDNNKNHINLSIIIKNYNIKLKKNKNSNQKPKLRNTNIFKKTWQEQNKLRENQQEQKPPENT